MLQDYYLTEDIMSLVATTAAYAMPTGIYANKLRYVQFDDGTEDYKVEVLPIKNIPNVQTGDDFTYRLKRAVAEVMKMTMYPTPIANDTTSVTRHFIRVPTVVTADISVIDLPDTTLLYHMVKLYLMKKKGDPLLEVESGQTSYYQGLYRMNLAEMIPDSGVTMEEDVSHYEEHC